VSWRRPNGGWRRIALLRASASLALLAACDGPQSILAPVGPAAGRLADLTWVLFIMGALVLALVTALLLYALLRRQRSPFPPTPEGDRRSTRWIVIGGVVFPGVVLSVLFVYVLQVQRAAGRPPADPDLVIEVIGNRWWWGVRYLSAGASREFETANEIHIPVGRPVRIRLVSRDVIHSFWVPRLQGKRDLIPGRVNGTWIQADAPGVYRGQCAEYCGLQHAKMGLLVIAQPPAEFAAWYAQQLRPAAPPADSIARRGQAVFSESGCAVCHTIRGTDARGELGPDLTHLASRRTLAAGTIPNTRGHLAGWIADPQALKPGNLMPAVPLDAADLQALLHYLETLR